MQERKYTYRMQWVVLAGSFLLLLLLCMAWISEGSSREWKAHQKAFAEISGVQNTGGLPEPEEGIFQVELPSLGRVDRCVTCHRGTEDPRMSGAPQPHSLHPGSYLEDHPVRDFGCTICHGGQGRALTVRDAHAKNPEAHWPFPLLEQPYIQASCGKCHLTVFDHGDSEPEGVELAMEGMDMFLQGKSIFSAEGCLGCHKARGVGGIIGPDLTQQGEKTRHEYSFRNIQGEQTISNWLKEHFRDPEMVSPGSRMLRVNLEEEALDALATFVMGMAKPEIPLDYFSLATLNEFKGTREMMRGEDGFSYLCSACHGKEGEGKSYTEYETGIPAIGSRDFLRVASADFIRFTLEKGRSLRQMGSWAGRISGLHPEELHRVTGQLKAIPERNPETMLEEVRGDELLGRALFKSRCAVCHGDEGRGDVAVALNQPGFLAYAGDPFILGTIIRGRGNTAMPAWNHLQDRELVSLVAYISSWSDGVPVTVQPLFRDPDPEQGALQFHYLCSRCHGESGEGDTGPAIINRDFLETADDMYLVRTISEGREHTAMFGWSREVVNQEKLEADDIGDIIAFMRREAGAPLEYIHAGSNPGNREVGQELFRQRCAECHGSLGEGIKGPALNNQEFLSAASNGYLMATITLGREGTAMPSWGYGDEEHEAISGSGRQDLVAFIRSWQRIRIKF